MRACLSAALVRIHGRTLDVGYSRARQPGITAGADPAASGYPLSQQQPLTRPPDRRRLRSVPRVLGATVSENGIFSGTESSTDGLRIDGFTSPLKEDRRAWYDQVCTHYFQVVGVPLLAGRDIDERDKAGAPPVVILNDVMARASSSGSAIPLASPYATATIDTPLSAS